MTLIVAYVDEDFVMQMSDERSSSLDPATKHWKVEDEHVKKQVLVSGAFLASFTGPTHIDGRKPTAQWLGDHLLAARGDLNAALKAMSVELNRVFSGMYYKKRALTLTAVLAGWGLDESVDSLRPVIGEITNMHPTTYAPLTEFFHQVGWAGEDEPLWMSRGQPLDETVESDLRDDLARALADDAPFETIARCFFKALRRMAAQNSLVGSSAVLGVLPRKAAERGLKDPDNYWLVVNGDGVGFDGVASFVRIPGEGDEPEDYEPLILPPPTEARRFQVELAPT